MGSQIPLLWGYNLLPQLNEVEPIHSSKERCISMKHSTSKIVNAQNVLLSLIVNATGCFI